MEKRYQVFISSTYSDLKDERSKVMKSIMDLDCIPAGMELFPAIDEEQFEFIKKIIDDCDYYLLIIGGRYGSMTESGISYTEMEFDYAMSKGIPVLAFLHDNINNIPAGKVEMNPIAREKLEQFREKVKKGRLVKFWSNHENLTSQVIISLAQTIKSRPGIGWVRANIQTNTESLQELNDLRKEVENLREFKLKSEETKKYTSDIADWDEPFALYLERIAPIIKGKDDDIIFTPSIEKTWEEWFKLIVTEIKRHDFFYGTGKEAVKNVISSIAPQYADYMPNSYDIEIMGYQFASYEVFRVSKFLSESNWTLTAKGEKMYARMMCVKTQKHKK